MKNNSETSLKLKLEWFIKFTLLVIVVTAALAGVYWVVKNDPINEIKSIDFAYKASSAFSLKTKDDDNIIFRR